MKDTRPVHMGTYEINKKHVENQISMLKVDIKNLTLNANRLNNRVADQEKKISTLTKGWVVLLIINVLAILLQTLL
jgi:hypothetical protein